jgi:hypothetical protein
VEVFGEETAQQFFVTGGGAELAGEVFPAIAGQDCGVELVVQIAEAGDKGDTVKREQFAAQHFPGAQIGQRVIQIGEGELFQDGLIRDAGWVEPCVALGVEGNGDGSDGLYAQITEIFLPRREGKRSHRAIQHPAM